MAFGSLKGTLSGVAASRANPNDATGSVLVALNDLIYVVTVEQTNATFFSPSDNLGNSYSNVSAGNDAGAVAARAYFSLVTVAGTLTTVHSPGTASADDVVVGVIVLSGPFDENYELDQHPAIITSDTTSPFTCPASGTLSLADEVVISWGAANYGTTWAATSPNLLALDLASSTNIKLAIGYQKTSDYTSIVPVFTAASNPTQAILCTSTFGKLAETFLPADWTTSTSFNDTTNIAGQPYRVDSVRSYGFSSPDNDLLRFELRSGDYFSKPGYSDAVTSERSEIYNTIYINDGTRIFIRYDFMIDPGTANTAPWMVLGQLHPDAGPAPAVEVAFNGNERMAISGNHDNGGTPVYVDLYTDTVDIVRGRWYNMQCDVNFTGATSGTIKVWRDGIQIVNFSGSLGFTDQTKNYWRFGIYRYQAAETVVVSYRKFSIVELPPSVTISMMGV